MIFGLHPTSSLPLAGNLWGAPEQVHAAAALDGFSMSVSVAVQRNAAARVLESFSVVSALSSYIRDWLRESLGITEALELNLTFATREVLAFYAPTTVRVDLSDLLSDQITLRDDLIYLVRQLLSESITLTDLTTTDVYRLALCAELLELADATGAALSLGLTAHDSLTASDLLSYLVRATASESLTTGDTASILRSLRERLTDRLDVAETLAIRASIAQTLLEALTVGEVLEWVKQATASEALALADDLTAAIRARLLAVDALQAFDTVASSLVVVRTAAEGVTLDDDSGLTLTAQLLAGERLAFIGRLPLGEETFSAWVLNTDTLGATSYTQFPMFALASHGGKTYGLTETGLYELTGETDDGAPIPAAIETGDLTPALHNNVNIPRAYLYLWANGDMRLRTISSQRGCRSEAWYDIEARPGADEQARIIRLARGVRGTTWQFRVENVDGCDFDLRGAEVLPVILSKRGARS